MNNFKPLNILSIVGLICSALLLSPSTALADKQYHKGKQHQQSSYSRHGQKSHSRSYRDKHRDKKHYSKKRRHTYSQPHYNRHDRHYRPYPSIRYIAYPWYVDAPFLRGGRLSIGYQDDNFGFVFRD